MPRLLILQKEQTWLSGTYSGKDVPAGAPLRVRTYPTTHSLLEEKKNENNNNNRAPSQLLSQAEEGRELIGSKEDGRETRHDDKAIFFFFFGRLKDARDTFQR